MKTKQQFADAVTRMRSIPGASVEVTDFYCADREPYRLAALKADCDHATAIARAQEIAALAIELTGYFTMHVHGDYAHLRIHVSRELGNDERRVPETVSFPINLDEAMNHER